MKYSFWLELPTTLINLLDSYVSLEDIDLSSKLTNSNKAMENITFKIIKEIDIISNNCFLNTVEAKEHISNLMKRLSFIEKEKNIIVVQSMKFSVKLVSKLTTYITKLSNSNDTVLSMKEIITKIKLLLNVIKTALNQVNIHLNYEKSSFNMSIEHENEIIFCRMLKMFFEKSESKIFQMSLSLITTSPVLMDFRKEKKIENYVFEVSKTNVNKVPHSFYHDNDFDSFHLNINNGCSQIQNQIQSQSQNQNQNYRHELSFDYGMKI